MDVPLRAGAGVTFVTGDPPRAGVFALWGPGVVEPDGEVELVVPAGSTYRRRRTPALLVPVGTAINALIDLQPDTATRSAAVWSVVVTAAVGLVARGRLQPAVSAGGWDAWRVGPLDPTDLALLGDLAAVLPPEAHAVAVPRSRPLLAVSAPAAVRAACDAVADAFVRTRAAPIVAGFEAFAARPRVPVAPLRGWLAEATAGLDAGAQPGLRVELPEGPNDAARAVLQVRSVADPAVVIDAAELWRASAGRQALFGGRAEADLLVGLRRGARAWPPLARTLGQRTPDAVVLDDDEVVDLLGAGGEALGDAGFELLWPAGLFADGLTLRATAAAPGSVAAGTLSMATLLDFRWQLAVGDTVLSEAELEELAEAKRPFLRLRGRWVAADPALVARVRNRRSRRLGAGEALAAALAGELLVDGELVAFDPPAPLADLAGRLSAGAPTLADDVPGLTATLRPYQRRGVAWLDAVCAAGLGGCLADDMGLGKTVQVIALQLLRRRGGDAPTLVVAPTSLLGNWEREWARFAPQVTTRRWHGAGRHLDDLAAGEVVLTTYATMRRDAATLAEVDWDLVVADEAQHVKNPLGRTARALRTLQAPARVALTGTPVENRLTDLWALLDWTTPGLLGSLEAFRRGVAVPVERYGDPDATERLARITRPFVLRRRKRDPGIADELPPKTETDHAVTLTAEQASLYEAVVRETLADIAAAEGIARRGLVLKLLTMLKQICNHPAQFLRQEGPLTGRSGKLDAFDELLDIAVASGESTLVFTQYVAMGALLDAHLGSRGIPAMFLRGKVPAKMRDTMVERFQAGEVPVLLLSLKAGGTGLNLTRATHVVHYDRWWNPAVEDQATDRAYRIGQDHPVQVHRLLAEGTVEDRIGLLLAAKRDLADAVVGTGEGWLSDLSDEDLGALVALGAQR